LYEYLFYKLKGRDIPVLIKYVKNWKAVCIGIDKLYIYMVKAVFLTREFYLFQKPLFLSFSIFIAGKKGGDRVHSFQKWGLTKKLGDPIPGILMGVIKSWGSRANLATRGQSSVGVEAFGPKKIPGRGPGKSPEICPRFFFWRVSKNQIFWGNGGPHIKWGRPI